MALMWLNKRKDTDFKAKYDSFTDMISFYIEGKKIAERTIEECKEIYPQYVWDQVKEEKNQFIIFVL